MSAIEWFPFHIQSIPPLPIENDGVEARKIKRCSEGKVIDVKINDANFEGAFDGGRGVD
jgi:hypothetical protein